MILTAIPGVLIISYQVFYGLVVWNGVCWDDSISGGLLTFGMLVWDYLNGIRGVQRELMGFPGDSVVKKKEIHLLQQETQFPPLGQEDPMVKKMATHCNILAWETPWTEVPGR